MATEGTKDLKTLILNKHLPFSINNSRRGLEKESLRIRNNKISLNNHPVILGSALCNQYITTDFAESLLEFITPPALSWSETIDFLESIEQFVINKIDSELLWPFSIPPPNISEKDIRIATYGSSNVAQFKNLYRQGLSKRYGKNMQTIAGIHYNYSFPDELFKEITQINGSQELRSIKSNIYLSTIRNILRNNWFLLYFFGSSPFVIEQLISKKKYKFKKHKDIYYLPYATSLRMSDIGYQNTEQSKLNISLDNLKKYISSLLSATSTKSIEFKEMSILSSIERSQLNENYLQIEDEYYSSARPKSASKENIRQIKKLESTGIEYLEIRSLDLDPYLPVGIGLEEMKFIDIFIVYCATSAQSIITKIENRDIYRNNLNVSIKGRKRDLKLIRNNKQIFLKDWANEILDEMNSLAEVLEVDIDIEGYKEKIQFSELTKSSSLLNNFLESKDDFLSYGLTTSLANKEYISRKKCDFSTMNILEKEVATSLEQQKEIEVNDDISFDEYLFNYFN